MAKKIQKAPVKIETAAYKGVRDFYPEDMFLEKYIFACMRQTAENFGYVEYGASILEPAELYRAKSGEEIVNEQTYTFTDRGDREVTLRPEMTPTVARLIAARRRELSFPLRWYSIPNLFRYEQPQRGRLREHFQLNVDLFGVDNERADIEIVSVAYQLLKNFGAQDKDFEIHINDRTLLSSFWDLVGLPATKRTAAEKLIDKKEKLAEAEFKSAMEEIAGKRAEKIIAALKSGRDFMQAIGSENAVEPGHTEPKSSSDARLVAIIDGLSKIGVTNVIFNPSLVRGFDYYSGFVFEIYDTHESNKRSLFGGGRYDKLLEIFGSDPVSSVGFGAGDVTIGDFLETHKLLPEYRSSTLLYLAVMDKEFEFADIIAEKLRDKGVSVAVDYTDRSIGDRIKKAASDAIPYFAIIGSAEAKDRSVRVKKLTTRTEANFDLDEEGITMIAEAILETDEDRQSKK